MHTMLFSHIGQTHRDVEPLLRAYSKVAPLSFSCVRTICSKLLVSFLVKPLENIAQVGANAYKDKGARATHHLSNIS